MFDFEISYLLFLEGLKEITGNILTPILSFVSTYFTGWYVLNLMAVIYWCINKSSGRIILLTSAFTSWLNSILKMTFCCLRPYLLSDRLSHFPKASGYSFPSGHASTAGGYWLPFAYCFKKKKAILLISVIIVGLVCFSRNYLGVHLLRDVLAGVGVAVFCLAFVLVMLNWIEKKKNRDILFLIFITALIGISLVYVIHKSYPLHYDGEGSLIVNPEDNFSGVFGNAGRLFGLIFGWYIEEKFVKFTVPKNIINKLIFAGGGVLILKVINSFFGKYFSEFAFLKALIISVFIILIYPLIIKLIDVKLSKILNIKKVL